MILCLVDSVSLAVEIEPWLLADEEKEKRDYYKGSRKKGIKEIGEIKL